ncbi:MAG: hypothetical protein JXL80_08525 [Planctomycetes bacterium]|nr:hypothetical protein [Planctomycetota bacterium]
MDGFTCDMCGKVLLADENTRYVARIEVFAAYDTMELTSDDIEKDHRREIERLLDQMRRADPQTLQDQVYKRFQFDLCPFCQKHYLAHPLPAPSGPGSSAAEGS